MGESTKRRAEIKALKEATRRREEQEYVTNRLACAVHESAHLIAALHFRVPVGEQGVSINNRNGSSEFTGFTHTLQSQVYGNINELSDECRTDYMAQALIGPITEYRLLNDRADRLVTCWISDIAFAVGRPPVIDPQQRVARSFDKDVQDFTILTTYCLTLIDNPGTPTPENVWAGNSNLCHNFKSAALLAERIRKQYEATIQSFANALIDVPRMVLSGGEVDRWTQKHFIRQVVQ